MSCDAFLLRLTVNMEKNKEECYNFMIKKTWTFLFDSKQHNIVLLYIWEIASGFYSVSLSAFKHFWRPNRACQVISLQSPQTLAHEQDLV